MSTTGAPSTLPRWLPRSLTGWILVAVIAGGAVGLLAPDSALIPAGAWAGAWFIRCLKLLVLPVVVTSLVAGIASLGDVARVGRLGAHAVAFYSATTAIAAVTGLALVNVIRPGVGLDVRGLHVPDKVAAGATLSPAGVLGRVFGDTLGSPWQSLRAGDTLTWIAAALLVGLALVVAGPRAAKVTRAIRTCEQVVMGAVRIVLWTAPLGVFGLLARTLAESGVGAITALAWYSFTVTAGLLIHGAIVLPALVRWLGGLPALTWWRGVRPALLVAVSTSSSNATLPVTLRVCEHDLRLSPGVTGFVLPLGATMNMDGTALYEAVAALFVAQAYGIDLSIGQQGVVLVTAMIASVGAAGIPSAGLVTMGMVFTAVGLPLEGTALILAVDRFLDMLRTAVNVAGDTVGAVVLDRWNAAPKSP